MSLWKRAVSLLTSIVLAVMLLPVQVFAAEVSAAEPSRDTVLVLDNSSSMDGEPIRALKQAAIKFCTSVLNAAGTNRAAIVVYDTGIVKTTAFTADLAVLTDTINSMDGEGSWTNIYSGIEAADELLQESDAAVKNMLILIDGLPTRGPTNSDGPYTSENTGYQYANALYKQMDTLDEEYHVYTLGFFHDLTGSKKDFAARLLTDLQNAGYYEVIDPNDLEFTFGDVATDITQEQLKQLYTKEHLAYYQDGFDNEIVKIGLPDSVDFRNTNKLLGNIVMDAANDKVSTTYDVASVITDALNLDFNFGEGLISNYELILADIVTSSYYQEVLEETYQVYFKDDTIQLLKGLSDYGLNNLKNMAQNAGVSVEQLREEWAVLASALDHMKVSDDPDEFARLFGECSVVVDKYVKQNNQKEFLESLNGKNGIKADVLGAVLGATLDTASDMMTYYASYDAYCMATETFKTVLVQIYFYAHSIVGTDAGGNPVYFGGLDEIVYSQALVQAIKNFLDQTKLAAEGAAAVAGQFVEQGIENLGSAFAEAAVDKLISLIPIASQLNTIRKALGLTAAGTMFLVDCMTEIDDRAYAASMIYHLFFLINYITPAADDFGSQLASATNTEDSFEWALCFDEAVRVWRCCSLMLCDFGIEFEGYCLQAAQDSILSWTMDKIEEANWCSTAIVIAEMEKDRISGIHCHNVNLSYDPTTGSVNLGPNVQVITIACPVTVTVTDENGRQIAVLADSVQTVEKGYEPYFHVLETERGSSDYMKICYIPIDWNVSFTGTGAGSMYVLKADIGTDGQIQNHVLSPEIAVSVGTEGHLETHNGAGSENMVVIDQTADVAGVWQITFEPNGGYAAYTSAQTVGGKLTSLPYATRSGYTFTGWYTAEGYPVTTDTVFTANTTLYAGWRFNETYIPVIPTPVRPSESSEPVEPEVEWIRRDGETFLYIGGELVTGWYQDEDGSWYWFALDTGAMAADEWVRIDGVWYAFVGTGQMRTGWFEDDDDKWYYLKPWGGMASGWQFIDGVWYYLRSDGSMAANAWVQTSGNWYYLTGSGEMAANRWIDWNGDWYFLYSSGVMATNTTMDGYTINSAGIWVQ